MKSLFLVLALQLFLISPAYAEEAPADAIKSTLSSLKKNVNNVSQGVSRLKQDKVSIERSLKDMEAWGTSEQEAKEFYFNQNTQLAKDLLDAHKKIADDAIEIKKLNDKYQYVKSILAYAAGALAALLYLRLGAAIVGALAGPYALVLSFLGPAGAFMLGYTLVRLIL
jgi:hypothetical protein